MPSLDDAHTIQQGDPQGSLKVVAKQHQQLLHETPGIDGAEFRPVKNVVLAGMGGSAEPGLYVRNWLSNRLKIPFIITRDYSVPGFADEDTLVIASSYSGNTEEAISALDDAKKRGAQIVCLTSGGKLKEIAQTSGYPLLLIPEGFQPRMTAWFFIRSLANLFEKLSLAKDITKELVAAKPNMEDAAKELEPAVPLKDNQAKQIAEKLNGTVPIIYASPLLASTAYKWKINFNENAKHVAFWNEFPEHNHNELNGWSHPDSKPFSIIELESSFDHPRIKKRFEVTNKLLKDQAPEPIQIKAQGENEIEQILWAVQLGDFVSLYLAIFNGVDPTPVPLVERLKKELG